MMLTLQACQLPAVGGLAVGPIALPAELQAALVALEPVATRVRLSCGQMMTPHINDQCLGSHPSLGLVMLRLLAYYGGVTTTSQADGLGPLVDTIGCSQVFPFDSAVVCVNAGQPQPRSAFDFGAALQHLCIQDPVDGADNLARGLQPEKLVAVRLACRNAALAILDAPKPAQAVAAVLPTVRYRGGGK